MPRLIVQTVVLRCAASNCTHRRVKGSGIKSESGYFIQQLFTSENDKLYCQKCPSTKMCSQNYFIMTLIIIMIFRKISIYFHLFPYLFFKCPKFNRMRSMMALQIFIILKNVFLFQKDHENGILG